MPRNQKPEIAVYLGLKWLITLVSGLSHGAGLVLRRCEYGC